MTEILQMAATANIAASSDFKGYFGQFPLDQSVWPFFVILLGSIWAVHVVLCQGWNNSRGVAWLLGNESIILPCNPSCRLVSGFTFFWLVAYD